MTKINRKAPFQKQLLDMSNAIDELQKGIVADTYTKEEADALFQTQEAMSDYFTKTQTNTNFVSKNNLTDYSISHIIAANSEIDSDTVNLNAVYSQDVKSEVSLDPNSTIIRTMSGTDNSTIGISATEIDITTSMLKYGTSEVATKTDISNKQDTLVSGTNIKTINNESLLGSGNITIPGYSGNHLYVIKGEGTDAITMGDETFKVKFFGVVSSASDWANGNKNLRTWVSTYGTTWLNTLNVVLIMPGKSDIYVDQGYISINANAEFGVSYDYHDGTQWKYNQSVTATEGYIHVDKIY